MAKPLRSDTPAYTFAEVKGKGGAETLEKSAQAVSTAPMSLFDTFKKRDLPTEDTALPGREQAMPVPARHYVNGNTLEGPFPETMRFAMFGMGCFWGVERLFWELPGVYSTASGYAAGFTPNPTYKEVCTGQTGHNEVVRVVFDPARVSYLDLLRTFWEGHDPTQGMRQGVDAGTQYRSGIYTYGEEQAAQAQASRDRFQEALNTAGHGAITTEIQPAATFYFAEEYHQQYLAKTPGGSCPIMRQPLAILADGE